MLTTGLYRFKGEDGSMRYKHGGLYKLSVHRRGWLERLMTGDWHWRVTIVPLLWEELPQPAPFVPYDDEESFKRNWEKF